MAFRYKHEQKTGFEGKVSITLVRYETLNELIEEHYQMPFEELAGGEVCGGDGNGGEYKLSFEEMIENISEMGCYGFACKKKGENEIHFWVNKETVDPVDFLGMIAHEKGHTMRPWKRDPLQEEARAERYGDTASFAFQIAKDILGMDFKKKAEDE